MALMAQFGRAIPQIFLFLSRGGLARSEKFFHLQNICPIGRAEFKQGGLKSMKKRLTMSSISQMKMTQIGRL